MSEYKMDIQLTQRGSSSLTQSKKMIAGGVILNMSFIVLGTTADTLAVILSNWIGLRTPITILLYVVTAGLLGTGVYVFSKGCSLYSRSKDAMMNNTDRNESLKETKLENSEPDTRGLKRDE